MGMAMLRRARKKGLRFENPVATQVGGLDTMATVLGLYLKALWTKEKVERVPREPLGPFRTDASVYESPPASGLRVTWMGHSAMLIEIDGVRVLVDPVWDERASPMEWAGPKRFFAAPLRLEEMPRLDVVLVSHDHYDHLGKKTVERLARMEATSEAVWVTSLGVGRILAERGVAEGQIAELDWTDAIRVRGEERGTELMITALPARHFSGRSLWNRFETLWSSFVLKGRRHGVYYGADSGMWDGFAEIGQEYGPFDLTMLEVGAFNELWKDIHMGPDGAAKAFAAMGASGLLMPIHWGLFDLALHGWRQPIERIAEIADAIGMRLWAPEPGLPTEVVRDTEHLSGWWKAGSPVRARRLASS
jgi:L-ascorbate metabolism protein UlaG (beta-lactamase superfamily)